ncbi:MAG: O-antigen polymerase [Ramlibacter sp.]|uniref:O-antigen ligase family protein n=1 Tax=Ramlibacter sp. TaxID=1917967 RepID=UPI0026232C8F|nr:O-antigen ligase family protein [Ramlibacter sp.]MDB5751289.1 O-antigen polymerase [Ramlibacter sp.]
MPAVSREPVAVAAQVPFPGEAPGSAWAAAMLAAMMFLAPALGVPHELMLQDTLKSIVVSFCALFAALLLFLHVRARSEPLRWHGVVWLPLLLLAYALGSMAWSHTYLAGVEAVRWFVFALLAWVALNTLSRERLSWLAWGIHAGAAVASLWAALQFWFGFDLFPQGPNPASTFVNRNFFAEFVVCTLPFSWLLLARTRRGAVAAGLALSTGLVIAAILMTGTRGALLALWLQLLVLLPLVAWRCRRQLAWTGWPRTWRIVVPALLVATVVGLGFIPSSNPRILEEARGASGLERGIGRTQSIGPGDPSLGVRMVMWRATATAIQARPFAGLGAGAWENEIPLYQAAGSQLETDYYVHNEFLQLVAEFGLVGWLFLVLLLGYLLLAAWRSWAGGPGTVGDAERPGRAVLLCSLLALLIVSCIGFPWRMAATGALFAICVGALAASDARLGWRGGLLARPLRWSPAIAKGAMVATLACLGLALFITQRAAESEHKLVMAAKIALSISASGAADHPRHDAAQEEMLQLVREGVAINPHYRKITPMVADELAKWGDWANATWIWESVLQSRPNVAALITNAARGRSAMGRPDLALAHLERARRIQPQAPAVRSLEVVLLARSGDEAKALALARRSVEEGITDFDLLNAMVVLAWRSGDIPLALRALDQRMNEYPESRPRGQVQLGTIYANELNEPAKALQAFRAGLALARSADEQADLLRQVPLAYRDRLRQEF